MGKQRLKHAAKLLSATAQVTSHLNVMVQSPFLHLEEPKWLVDSPRVSSLGDAFGIFLLVFCSCCLLCGHRWAAFLILSDHPLSCLPTYFTQHPLYLYLSFLHPKISFFPYIYSGTTAHTHTPFFKQQHPP